MGELPKQRGVGFLDGDNENSSFIVTGSETRPSDIYMAVAAEYFRRNNIVPTRDDLRELQREAAQKDAEYFGAVRERGVALHLRKLLRAKRRKEAVQIAKSMVITAQEMADLIMNCGQLGLSHHGKHLEFLPPEREMTDGEVESLKDAGAADPERAAAAERAKRKAEQMFEEREYRSVHLFANSEEWHCFFSSFRDSGGDPRTGKHHWQGGSHLHYVSHLYPPLTRERVWLALDQRKYSLPKEHIRFSDPGDIEDRERRFLIARKGRVFKV